MEQVNAYFATHSKDECYTTCDGMVFHQKGDAQLHAQSLKDKTVARHTRTAANDTATAAPDQTAVEADAPSEEELPVEEKPTKSKKNK